MVNKANVIFKKSDTNLKDQDSELYATAKKLDSLKDKTDKVIFKTSSVFPFKFFKDDLIIDPVKIDLVEREFFFNETIRSIPYDQIIETQILSGWLFSTLKILSKGLKSELAEIGYLKRSEAKKAKKLIDGLVLCRNNNIDLVSLENEEFASKIDEIEEIGKTPDLKS